MALLTKAPRGVSEVLPQDAWRWQFVERQALEVARLFGFKEIRPPTFEHTELFTRSVGDTTDVVQKEMYTFEDKGGRSVTLRPEGTAGVVRSVLEHSLLAGPLPLSVCYVVSCFRYEKPQAGRFREFHQFGAEMFGTSSPLADAQLIAMVDMIFKSLHIEDISLELNSIGCPNCRPAYHETLKAYFEGHRDALCPTCQGRLDKNPLRILDCKSPVCQGIAQDAPLIIDHLCGECEEHFAGLKAALDSMDITYTVNPRIVRGLDYYTKTVFEFVSSNIGAQGTVCGGGRYDGLVEELGGPPTPALGYAMGLERIQLLLQNVELPAEPTCDFYLASHGDEAARMAATLAERLRRDGIAASSDIAGRSVKAQMKYADKLGAKFTVVLGSDELASGQATAKDMDTGDTAPLPLGDAFVDTAIALLSDKLLASIPTE